MTTTSWTIERELRFTNEGPGRGKQAREGPAAAPPPKGRVQRVAKLMAQLRFDELLRTGAVASQVELARLGHVTPARVTQVMNLLHLASDFQEQLLFLPRTERKRDHVILAQLQPIAGTLDWREQRRQWENLRLRGPS